MSLRDIKQRIHSVKSTQKITSAMKLVSAAKLRRTQAAIDCMRPYEQKLSAILSSFLGNAAVQSEYNVPREVKKVVVIPIASDTTLCGAFNSNVIRLAKEVVDEYRLQGIAIEIMPVGKKIHEYFKKQGMDTVDMLMKQAGAPQYPEISLVAKELMQRYAAGEIDRIELVYTHSVSASKQIPQRELFLPVDTSLLVSDNAVHTVDFIIEPTKEELLQSLIPKVIQLHLYTVLLDSSVAEHAARMIAMQIATDNADDLIAELTLEYNKGRQQAITNELLDILSGSLPK